MPIITLHACNVNERSQLLNFVRWAESKVGGNCKGKGRLQLSDFQAFDQTCSLTGDGNG
jgi:hypothetical protein